MTVTVRTNKAKTIREYLIVPNQHAPTYVDQPSLVLRIGNNAPGIEPSFIQVMHNAQGCAHTISACVDELPNDGEATKVLGIPEFDMTDEVDWDAHLDKYAQTYTPSGIYRYVAKVTLRDSDATILVADDLLEAILDKFVDNGVMFRSDADHIIQVEERFAGNGEDIVRGK